MRLRTIGLISTLALGLHAVPSQDLTQVGILLARLQAQFQLPLCRQSLIPSPFISASFQRVLIIPPLSGSFQTNLRCS